MRDEELRNWLEQEFKWLHRHPELANEEFETTARLREDLTSRGIRLLDLPLQTGLVAEIGRGEPLMALRADIDALPLEEETDLPYRSRHPGKMHACGHDFHTASVLGAALLLKEREAELPGRVRVVFQPAEESSGGSGQILATGALAEAGLVFGLHVSPLLPVGTLGIKKGAVTASVDRFGIRILGKSTHAAHPERGVDPLVIAASLISAAQTIVSRSVDPAAPNLVSFTRIEGGNTWNVIPSEVFLEGTTRSLAREDRQLLKERLTALAEGIALAHGARAEIEWYQGPPPTDNDPEWTNRARELALQMGFRVIEPPVSLAGEDFALYQESIPGVFVLVGTGLSPANHNSKFRADPQALLPAARYLARLAEDALHGA